MVHLHVHSYFSLQDAITSLEDIVSIAKEQNAPAVAITDHGAAGGWYRFASLAKKEGIKPILGIEVYIIDDIYEQHTYADITPLTPEEDAKKKKFGKKDKLYYMDKYGRKYYHLILLAQNEIGLRNLAKLNKMAYEKKWELKTWKPRIDKKWLREHNEGLIALSACLVGEPMFFASARQYDELEKRIKEYLDIFGDRYYLEIMYHGIDREKAGIPVVVEYAKQYNIPLVVTTDAHYARKEDAYLHAVIHGKEEEGEGDFFNNPEYYLKTDDEIREKLSEILDRDIIDEMIKTTYEIAEKIDFIPYENINYILPEIDNADDEIVKRVMEGIQKKYGHDKKLLQDAIERAEYELGVIKQMGFSTYFLLVQDFVKAAWNRGILVGPGRGSAGGSIVAYALDITQIDPLKYNLIFERFLNPARVSMPDIDIDFDAARRDEMYEYLAERYGEDNVARIVAYGTRNLKGALDDATRMISQKYDTNKQRQYRYAIDAVKRKIENNTSLDDVYNLLKEAYIDDKDREEIFKVTKALLGMPKNLTIHAAGAVISPTPIYYHSPVIYVSTNGKVFPVTEFDKEDVEHVGLVKMDLLSLSTLTIIRRTAELLEESTGKSAKEYIEEFYEVIKDPTDKRIYEMISKGDTEGLFQIESQVFTRFLQELKPTKFEELVAALALNRPGPMSSGGVAMYLRRKHGEEDWRSLTHPDLHDILEETYGVIVYQEQIMQIAQKVAGFTMSEADILRKAIGKKKKDVLDAQKSKFIRGGMERGYNKTWLEELWAAIEKFGEYGFNKSHSAAYSLVTYMTGYIKLHYPVAFYAALIESSINNTSKVVRLIQKAKKRGIEVLTPTVKTANFDKVRIIDNKIVLPIVSIKGIGKNATDLQSSIEAFINNANNLKSADDILAFNESLGEKKLKKSKFLSLVKAGFFNDIETIDNILQALENKKRKKKKENHLQSLFAEVVKSDDNDQEIAIEDMELTPEEIIENEIESFGFFISEMPIKYKDVVSLARNFSVIPVSFVEFLPPNSKFASVVAIMGITEKKGKLSFVMTDGKTAVDATVYNLTKRDLVDDPNLPNQKLDIEIAKNIYLFEGKKTEDGRIWGWKLSKVGRINQINQNLINAFMENDPQYDESHTRFVDALKKLLRKKRKEKKEKSKNIREKENSVNELIKDSYLDNSQNITENIKKKKDSSSIKAEKEKKRKKQEKSVNYIKTEKNEIQIKQETPRIQNNTNKRVEKNDSHSEIEIIDIIQNLQKSEIKSVKNNEIITEIEEEVMVKEKYKKNELEVFSIDLDHNTKQEEPYEIEVINFESAQELLEIIMSDPLKFLSLFDGDTEIVIKLKGEELITGKVNMEEFNEFIL